MSHNSMPVIFFLFMFFLTETFNVARAFLRSSLQSNLIQKNCLAINYYPVLEPFLSYMTNLIQVHEVSLRVRQGSTKVRRQSISCGCRQFFFFSILNKMIPTEDWNNNCETQTHSSSIKLCQSQFGFGHEEQRIATLLDSNRLGQK